MAKRSIGFQIFNIFNILFMLFVCAMIMVPYLNVLAVALNDNARSAHSGLMLLPAKATLANFQALLSDSGIWHAGGVTLLRLAVGVPLTLAINFTGSYALSKSWLPGRRALSLILMIPSYIGAGLIPTYILYAQLHLLNSFWVYVLPVGFWFFGFILLRTYFYTIPDSLEESAKLDGANDLVVMLRIHLPLALPILATLTLFSAVTHWNDWTTTLYFVTNYKSLSTLAFELQRVLREQDRISRLVQEAIIHGLLPPASSSGTSEGLRNAQIIVTTLPIILVYPFLQRYFIQGMLVGSIKE
jgi:putative aldouronate transport system permease protein